MKLVRFLISQVFHGDLAVKMVIGMSIYFLVLVHA